MVHTNTDYKNYTGMILSGGILSVQLINPVLVGPLKEEWRSTPQSAYTIQNNESSNGSISELVIQSTSNQTDSDFDQVVTEFYSGLLAKQQRLEPSIEAIIYDNLESLYES